ncbi:MAG: AAA family ATPase [Bacteroidia bacterium]
MEANRSRRARIGQLIERMSHQLFEKEETVRLALLSALAGESIFLLGPPGVAKSMIARRLKHAFRDARAFEYLMGKFSTPDEVFGPVSISKLKNEDKYERLTAHYLPGAQIVFLDEIWKASPPIQNALLTVLNEKIYRNGEHEMRVDLRGLIAASNELPLEGEGLEALWDRFLVRQLVDNIQDDMLFGRMLLLPNIDDNADTVPDALKIGDDEYQQWQRELAHIDVPVHILGLVGHLRRRLQQRNSDDEPLFYVSDRRWRKIIHLLRASAFLNERQEIHVMDCFLIVHCLWSHTDQIEEARRQVQAAIKSHGFRRLVLLDPIRSELQALQAELDDELHVTIHETIVRPTRYQDKAGQTYHRVLRFWGEAPAYLRVADYEKLAGQEQSFVPLFEEAPNNFRPFQTYGLKAEPQHKVATRERSYDVETEPVAVERREVRKPDPAKVRIWETQVQSLLDLCEQGLGRIEARRQIESPYWGNHLFVSPTVGRILDEALQTMTNDLLHLKLDIQKTRHSYASLV